MSWRKLATGSGSIGVITIADSDGQRRDGEHDRALCIA